MLFCQNYTISLTTERKNKRASTTDLATDQKEKRENNVFCSKFYIPNRFDDLDFLRAKIKGLEHQIFITCEQPRMVYSYGFEYCKWCDDLELSKRKLADLKTHFEYIFACYFHPYCVQDQKHIQPN